MTTSGRERFKIPRHVLWLGLLTLATLLGWFLLDGRYGLSFADEGWLWYGTEALRRGEVPMRDFAAYDPGRYVWTAAWSFLLGRGLLSLRLACVFFQCLGVFAGLLIARRLSKNWLFLVCVALLLSTWMQPRFKSFEQTVALMAGYAAVLLLEKPSIRRHWWVGVFGGLSAFIGRNHGAYHVLAFGLIIAWGAWGGTWQEWLRRSLAWGAGLLTGYLPQLLMFLFVPGYFAAFRRYIEAMVASGSTNLSAPVPWPWLVRSDLPPWTWLSGIVEGCWYVALPLLLAVVAGACIFRRQRLLRRPVLVATACVTLPYTHFVFSRPDIVHLGHAAAIAALTAIALAFSLGRNSRALGYTVAAMLLAASLLANLFQLAISLPIFLGADNLFQVNVRGDRLAVVKPQAQVLESARHLSEDLAKPDEPILFMPMFPTLYPFTGRRSPTYEIYFVTPPEDRKLLDEIKAAGVKWVMVQDHAVDGREELRFRNTNPLVMHYFRSNFDRVKLDTLPTGIFLLHRRDGDASP